jgi:hypothetical protein
MLDHRTPAHFEVQYRTLVLLCQAFSREGHVLELLPLRFQRWKSESLQGLITTGTSPIQLGASRQASPNRLRTWTGPSALAAPALSIAPPSTVLTTTRARPTPRINPNTRMYRYQHGRRWIAADYGFLFQSGSATPTATAVVKTVVAPHRRRVGQARVCGQCGCAFVRRRRGQRDLADGSDVAWAPSHFGH